MASLAQAPDLAAAVLASMLAACAILLWPARSNGDAARSALRSGTFVDGPGEPGSSGDRVGRAAGDELAAARPDGRPPSVGWPERLRELWHEDPVEVMRRWRSRRGSQQVAESALRLLEAISPALRAGLAPQQALRLAATAIGQPTNADTRRMVHSLTRAVEDLQLLAPVWSGLARTLGSRELGFVGAAWQLSEATGAPLAEAVDRAVDMLRAARERQRRVAVAVAGPQATVTVLTVLPLTGPAFGLACGVPPADLYLGSPLALVSAASGVVLVVLGRAWCRAMVRKATGAGTSR